MKSQSPRGFAVIEAILVLVVIGLILGTAYYVWRARQATDDTISATGNSTTAAYPKATTQNTADEDAIVNTTYSKVPKALRVSIFNYTKAEDPGCIKGDQIVDYNGKVDDPEVTYMAKGYAETPVGCDGGAGVLFALSGGAWKQVGATQDLYDCATVTKYGIPTRFMAKIDPQGIAQCVDASGNTRQLE